MAGCSRPSRYIVEEQQAFVPLKKLHSPPEHIINKAERETAEMGRWWQMWWRKHRSIPRVYRVAILDWGVQEQ